MDGNDQMMLLIKDWATACELRPSAKIGHLLEMTRALTRVRTFERLQAREAEIVQEPMEQPYGVRDCAVRDPVRKPYTNSAVAPSLTTRCSGRPSRAAKRREHSS
jgi:uncharacterized glyoxalase superfamily protein PhnB